MYKQIFILAIVLFAAAAAFAQPPYADLTFNGTGRNVTNFTFNTDTVKNVLLQSDGKIILAGTSNMNNMSIADTTYFSMARLNTDGTLDTTFGTNGKVAVDFSSFAHNDIVRAAAIQPDDKIVLAGQIQITIGNNLHGAVMRFNADGSVDNTFGTNGKVMLTFASSNSSEILGVTVAPSGEVVVAGTYWNGNSRQTAAVRLSATGTFLAEMTYVEETGSGGTNGPNAVRVQSDGKIVTGGYHQAPSPNVSNIKLVRFNTDGTRDSGFGTGGVIWEDVGVPEAIYDIELLPDGRIIACGTRGSDFLVMRFLSNGQRDLSFGTNGRAVTTFNSSYAIPEKMTVRPNGKILLAGRSVNDIAVAYYNADGSPDTSFSGDGKLAFNFPAGSGVIPSAVTIDSSGRPVLGGASSEGTGGNAAFAAVRLKTLDHAPVTIIGRVRTPSGNPISGLQVALTDESGFTTYTLTSSLGYFQFDNVYALQQLNLSVSSKKFIVPGQTFFLNGAVSDLELTGTPYGELAPAIKNGGKRVAFK